MKKNKIKILTLILICILLLAIILCIFLIKPYKTVKIGNTINKSAEEIKNYILNISSYELIAQITVNSNKNQNKYIVKQKYDNKENTFKQEVIEPENIKGLTTIYDGKKLSIENTNLGLSSFYEDYSYIGDNNLCLNCFIEEYKNNNGEILEEENEIEMKVQSEKYTKTLYIDKQSTMPQKMLVQDRNQKTLVYIEYNEIKVNELSKQEVLAFKI